MERLDGRARLRPLAERIDGGETVDAMAGWARDLGINLIGGSIAIAADDDAVHNVSLAFDRRGERVAAATPRSTSSTWTSAGSATASPTAPRPGGDLVTAELDGVTVGLTVCYDLRFPELYRALTLDRGARILTIPSNFTLHTGMAHWEVLLRARAIENQAFVLATGQHGTPGGLDKPSYGHSMIIDPWGTVLAQSPEGDGVIVADLDLDAQTAIRERLPALLHIRPDLYQTAHPAHT